MIKNILFVALGSGIGGALRYLISGWVQKFSGMSFPAGTMTINVLGCLLIGLFTSLALKNSISADAKLLLTTGLCGGFTTFSTFMNENLGMMKSEQMLQAAAYTALSLFIGLIAVWAGNEIGKLL